MCFVLFCFNCQTVRANFSLNSLLLTPAEFFLKGAGLALIRCKRTQKVLHTHTQYILCPTQAPSPSEPVLLLCMLLKKSKVSGVT